MTRSFSGSGLADRTAAGCFQAGHAGSIPVARSTRTTTKLSAPVAPVGATGAEKSLRRRRTSRWSRAAGPARPGFTQPRVRLGLPQSGRQHPRRVARLRRGRGALLAGAQGLRRPEGLAARLTAQVGQGSGTTTTGRFCICTSRRDTERAVSWWNIPRCVDPTMSSIASSSSPRAAMLAAVSPDSWW